MDTYDLFKEYTIKRKGMKISASFLMNKYKCSYQEARIMLERAEQEGRIVFAGGQEYTIISRRGMGRYAGRAAAERNTQKSGYAKSREAVCAVLREHPATVPEIMYATGISYMELQGILKDLTERRLAECPDGMEWKASECRERGFMQHVHAEENEQEAAVQESAEDKAEQESAGQEPAEEKEGSAENAAPKVPDPMAIAKGIYKDNARIKEIAYTLQYSVMEPEDKYSPYYNSFLDTLESICEYLINVCGAAKELEEVLSSVQNETKQLQSAKGYCKQVHEEAGRLEGIICRTQNNPELAKVSDVQEPMFRILNSFCCTLYDCVLQLLWTNK